MVGVVLGLGFQWWPLLQEPWQYVAFVFAYLDVVDYWIDYSPSLKKFPPKREIDVLLDIGIVFTLFLYIYATLISITYFLTAFVALKVLDYFWLLSSKYEYQPAGTDKLFVDTWLRFNLIEVCITIILIGLAFIIPISHLIILAIFIVFRLIMRILASWQYKKVHFS